MALTTIKTGAIADDAVTTDKLANAINTERTANTAKDLTALSASNLTSGTVPDARFPATLPAASAANLTSIPAGNLTGTVADARFPATLPAASAANLTSIPAANITGTLPAISGANLTGISSAGKAHNLVINGAMQVAQRGTSATGSGANGYATVDRFRADQNGTDAYIEQHQVDIASGETPYTEGFRKAFQVKNGNQTSGAGAGDYVRISHRIEAGTMAQSGWNYVSASSNITLSFWVKSSVAQNFYGFLRARDGTEQRYAFETGSLSANTWTKVTKTIPGNSNLQFDTDTQQNANYRGLDIIIFPFFGTDYTDSGVSLNTWGALSSGTQTPDNTSTWYTTDDAKFELTGVQLEVGDSATDFEHLSYADELIKCMRYYQIVIMSGHPSGGGTTGGLGGTPYSNGSSVYCPYRFPVEMRAEPSMISSSGTGSGSGTFRTRRGNNHNFNSFQGTNTINPTSGTFITNGNAGGGDVGAYIWIETNAGAKLALDAEL